MAIDYSKAYYKTWRNSLGWDMRMEIHLANNYARLYPSDLVKLDESVMTLKNSKWSFKDIPVGTPDAATLGVEFDFGALPSNLQQALLVPNAQSQGDGEFGALISGANGDGTAVSVTSLEVTNVVYLFSDRGDKGGKPLTATLTGSGTGYTSASGVATTTSGGGSGLLVDYTAQYKAVQVLQINNGGTSGYTNNTAAATFNGSGSGCVLDIECSGGQIINIKAVQDGGSGYKVGDLLGVVGGSNDAELKVVSTVGDGHITSFTLVNAGATGYSVGDTINIGTGGARLSVATVSEQPRYVEFIGAQSPEFGGKIGIDASGALTGRCEIVFFDLMKTMLETVPMTWWCSAVYRNHYYADVSTVNPGTLPGGTPAIANTLIQYSTIFHDLAVTGDGKTNYVMSDDVCNQGHNPAYTGVVMSLEKCVVSVTELLLKRLANLWSRASYIGNNTFTVHGSPFAQVQFYKQNYLRDHKRGATVSSGDLGFVASIVKSDKSGAPGSKTWMLYTAERLAGMCEPDKNGESLATGTLWDFITDLSKNFGCKVQWNYVAHKDYTDLYSYDMHLYFTPILNTGVAALPPSLSTELDRTESEWYDYQPASNVLSNHSCELRNVQDIDMTPIQATSVAGKGKARTSSQLVFHNHPSGWSFDQSKSPLSFRVNGKTNELKQLVTLSLRKLWYKETASLLVPETDIDKSKRVFKVHESVHFYAGELGSTSIVYKYASVDDSGDADNVATLAVSLETAPIGDKYFIQPEYLLLLQENALGRAMAQSFVKIFGNIEQSTISRAFEISTTMFPYCIGDMVTFPAPSGTPIPEHSGRAQGYLMSIDVDWDRSVMRCDILTSGL